MLSTKERHTLKKTSPKKKTLQEHSLTSASSSQHFLLDSLCFEPMNPECVKQRKPSSTKLIVYYFLNVILFYLINPVCILWGETGGSHAQAAASCCCCLNDVSSYWTAFKQHYRLLLVEKMTSFHLWQASARLTGKSFDWPPISVTDWLDQSLC